ncbi:Rha family transcriptional regulator [Enterococcus faecium]|uniref:Rha family transcriptional regulator n=1 Tax=Enterococcus faecium TaxID=1352 RepID=UPI000FD8BDC6|nr:Rha family transcriptional regulator [Enterococcus faecium]NRE56986.1 Rha family transcriptional regulator [Enterococcus faecium]NRE68713.1 Rha family transcriptional regulator [Enterococcus faecium]NTK82680.1 Rha family transcriptional regulator [Enterococcus faecium]NTK85742.1 Rha family transcriptional regulator [Enterococcus faecium]NTK88564.1 Rha family transcriptional regulator [Enterococcus faecium]
MQELVILKNKEAVTTSLQVAEAFEKQHKNVIQAIEDKIQSAENSAHYQQMFAVGSYEDSRGRKQKIYYMNRDGFTFIAMGFTGRKADEFKLKYIKAFNEMEKAIKEQQIVLPTTHREIALLALAANEETNERVDAIESDLNDLKNNQLLAEPDYRTISNMVRNKIRVICNQQHLNSKAKAELFKDLNGGIKRITGAVARNRIKAKQFDDVIEFINNWMPSTATMTIIKQMELLEDE